MNSEMLQAFDARLRLAKNKFGRRDEGQHLVRQVRAGEMDLIKPELFPEDLPKSVVANIIDTSARDTAEMIAALPSLACSSRNMNSAADNRRAELKNRIGTYYLEKSHVARQNIDFCDSGLSYSVGAYFVDPLIPTALIGGAAMYSQPAQSLLRAAVSARPQSAQAVRDSLLQTTPRLLPGAAQVGLGLLN